MPTYESKVRVFLAIRTISGLSALASLLLLLPADEVQAQPATSPQTLAVATTSGGPAAQRRASPADKYQSKTFTATMPTKTQSGFRLGGAPELDFVFGDIDVFKRKLDAFELLHKKMSSERVTFASATHAAQQVLAKPRVKGQARRCPASVIAQDYALASQAGIRYQSLGGDLESAYFAIRKLDKLGESTGLTPDYRLKVKRSGARYRQALTDLREMRTVFRGELEAGLRARGCQSQKLLALAPTLGPKVKTKSAAPAEAALPIAASTATFFVDNQSCEDAMRVHVDGILLGSVAPGKKAAFQSLMGRHSLCLLGVHGELSCGETGTLRNAFVYDGFSVSRHCDAKPQ